MAGRTTKRALRRVGRELKRNPPKALRGKTGKARERQRRAILLSKARRRGARI